MARKRMVTRTIKAAKVEALCMDIQNATPCTKSVTIPATYKSPAELLKMVGKAVDIDGVIKAVSIISTNIEETLYGMDEQKFIEMAEILPPRGANDSDEDDEIDA